MKSLIRIGKWSSNHTLYTGSFDHFFLSRSFVDPLLNLGYELALSLLSSRSTYTLTPVPYHFHMKINNVFILTMVKTTLLIILFVQNDNFSITHIETNSSSKDWNTTSATNNYNCLLNGGNMDTEEGVKTNSIQGVKCQVKHTTNP